MAQIMIAVIGSRSLGFSHIISLREMPKFFTGRLQHFRFGLG